MIVMCFTPFDTMAYLNIRISGNHSMIELSSNSEAKHKDYYCSNKQYAVIKPCIRKI
jgi:hypothetical protein